MIKNKTVIAIIPARSGSKGLPNKNIRLMNGLPLLQWPILCAMHSKYIDHTILSTDSLEYSNIGKAVGADVPFLRPESLAADNSSSIDVLLYTLENLKKQFDIIVLLEATSPLTRAYDIDRALEAFVSNDTAQAMVSVIAADSHHPEYAIHIDQHSFISSANSGLTGHTPRQQLEKAFFPDGSFYISNINYLQQSHTFYHNKTMTHCVERWQSPEIDDLIDFKVVELILKEKKGMLSLEEWQKGDTEEFKDA